MSEKLILSKSSVDFYWKHLDERMLKIITMMENVEPWVVDDTEQVATKLIEFGKNISNAKTGQLSQHSEDITTIMTYIFAGKALRLLNWLDDKYPGLSFHYIMEARQREDWDSGRLLLERLKTIKTLSLLGHIFTPMRTRLISSLLDEEKNKTSED